MKTNKIMRIASLILVAVMLSTCAISGTFAKYVTDATGTDSARVAKFGVQITANGTTFATKYLAKDDNTGSESASAEATTVLSTDKVVAPGTKGTMAAMKLTGIPEVDVKVTYEATVELNAEWMAKKTVDQEETFYFPLVITVEGAEVDLSKAANAEDVEKAIKDAIDAYSQTYTAGTDLSTVGADSLEVKWEWPFEVEGNDYADTYLGDQAAANAAGRISLTVKTTVTQID